MCVLLSFLDVQLPKTAFPEDGNLFLLLLFFFSFIRQSVIVFQKIGKNQNKERKKERERERKKKIDSFTKLSCLRKSGMNE